MAPNTAVVSGSFDLTSRWNIPKPTMVQILNIVTNKYQRSTLLQGPRSPRGRCHCCWKEKASISSEMLACVQTPPPLPLSKNQRRGPSPILTEGRGGLYTGYEMWPTVKAVQVLSSAIDKRRTKTENEVLLSSKRENGAYACVQSLTRREGKRHRTRWSRVSFPFLLIQRAVTDEVGDEA